MTLIPVHWLTYIVGNSMMLIIYKMKSPFFERYKIQSVQYNFKYRNHGLGRLIQYNGVKR